MSEYELGDTVWLDADNDGVQDAGETPVSGVEVHLFTDADGDGLADDVNGDGVIDAADAIATTTTDADGTYLFDGLESDSYIVGVAPSAFATGTPLEGTVPSTFDTAEQAPGYVLSTPINPDGSDTDLSADFGFWVPEFDLALRIVLEDPTATEVEMGELVNFTITVFNQGDVDTNQIDLVNYLPAGLELADANWTMNSLGQATYSVDQMLPAGETMTVTITTRVVGSDLNNTAEIAQATPLDSDGNVLVDVLGASISDVDSSADQTNGENPVDNEVDNGDGDEDDHDVVIMTLVAGTSEVPLALAFTGVDSKILFLGALLLITTGMAMTSIPGRRRQTEQ